MYFGAFREWIGTPHTPMPRDCANTDTFFPSMLKMVFISIAISGSCYKHLVLNYGSSDASVPIIWPEVYAIPNNVRKKSLR